jgi:hypothetical protein
MHSRRALDGPPAPCCLAAAGAESPRAQRTMNVVGSPETVAAARDAVQQRTCSRENLAELWRRIETAEAVGDQQEADTLRARAVELAQRFNAQVTASARARGARTVVAVLRRASIPAPHRSRARSRARTRRRRGTARARRVQTDAGGDDGPSSADPDPPGPDLELERRSRAGRSVPEPPGGRFSRSLGLCARVAPFWALRGQARGGIGRPGVSCARSAHARAEGAPAKPGSRRGRGTP